jgi:hypothetical protein
VPRVQRLARLGQQEEGQPVGTAAREHCEAGDVLASLTTLAWNAPSKSWTGAATMADSSLIG